MDLTRRVAPEVDCPCAVATAEEWAAVRAPVVNVAERAAFTGYASDRMGRWEISVQRQSMGQWLPGWAEVLVTLVFAHSVVRRWRTELPMSGGAQ